MDARRDRRAPRGRAERARQALGLKERRIDALGERADLVERGVDVLSQLGEHPLRIVRVALGHERNLDPEGDEVLLGPIVEVSLERAPLRLHSGEDPEPRSAHLVLEVPRLQREQGRGPGRVQELGVGLERRVVHDGGDGSPAAVDPVP